MKTILVTGSSRGIGKAIALRAAKQGYKVIVHGKTDSPELHKVHEQIEGSIKTFFDISDKTAATQAISKLGPIDILVNNAGIARNFIGDVQDVSDDAAIDEFRTNVLGTLHCIQAVLPQMEKSDAPAIINIASIKGHANLATLSTLTYATTKAGVISLTKALAKAHPNVRFASISPGYVETDQVSDWNEETFKRISEGTISGRIGKPEEIAGMAVFLMSDEASYITGTDFLVDGGYSIKGK